MTEGPKGDPADDETVALGTPGTGTDAPAGAPDETVVLGPDAGLPEPLPASPPPPPPGPADPAETAPSAAAGPVSHQGPTPWPARPRPGTTPPATVRAPAGPAGPAGPGGPGGPRGPRGPGGPSGPAGPPRRGGGSSNALAFVAVGGVIVLVVVIVVMALALGFGGDDDGDETTATDSTTTAAETTTSTTTTTTSTPPGSADTTAPPASETTVPLGTDPADLPTGLLCRDLLADGVSYDGALSYWFAQGRAPQMDEDGDGIPCETVYPAAQVEAVWGPQGTEEEGIEPGLLCRDLEADGLDYAAAYAYWEHEGRPARMDDDGNGVPCESVYPAEDVQAFLG